MGKAKTQGGPPQDPPALAAPTPDPPDGSEDTLGAGLDEPVLLEDESGAAQLLSTAVPDGLSSPFASTEDGWSIGSQAPDPGANVESGNLKAYVGHDVDSYSGDARDASSNVLTGGQDINALTGFPEVSFASGGGKLDTTEMWASNESAKLPADWLNYPSLNSMIDSVTAGTYEQVAPAFPTPSPSVRRHQSQ